MRIVRTVVFAGLLAICPLAHASVILTFDAGPTDVTALRVGETVTVTVHLDLNGTIDLLSLGGTVQVTNLLAPSAVELPPNTVIPDPNDFIPAVSGSEVDAQFFANVLPISDSGPWFKFDVTPTAVAIGTIKFLPLTTFAQDGSFASVDVTSIPMDFRIVPTTVPEPTTFSSLAVLGMLSLASRPRRKRRV